LKGEQESLGGMTSDEVMVKFLKSTVCESWMETRVIRDTAKIKSVSAHTTYKLSQMRPTPTTSEK